MQPNLFDVKPTNDGFIDNVLVPRIVKKIKQGIYVKGAKYSKRCGCKFEVGVNGNADGQTLYHGIRVKTCQKCAAESDMLIRKMETIKSLFR